MYKYGAMPDGMDAQELRPHIEALLAETCTPAEEVLQQLYQLSLVQADTMEPLDPELEARVTAYVMNHMNYDDPSAMLPILVMIPNFPLDEVDRIITRDLPSICNEAVLALIRRYRA